MEMKFNLINKAGQAHVQCNISTVRWRRSSGGGKGVSVPLCRRFQIWIGYSFVKVMKGSGLTHLTLEALRGGSKPKHWLFSSRLYLACLVPLPHSSLRNSTASPSTAWLSRPGPPSDLSIESFRDLLLLGQ